VTVAAVREALEGLGSVDANDAVAILRQALAPAGVRVERVTQGRPLIVDLVADAPVAWGEGVIAGDLIDDDVFAPIVLERGGRARAAVFRAATRSAGLGMFTIRMNRAVQRDAYDIAFCVLIDERRSWQINRRELEFVARKVEPGATWNRIRHLRSGGLRMEMPKSPSDFDLPYRMGPPPKRRP
jgi:hypothetical protein